MTVFTINGKSLIVDCGVLFPDANQPGVDLLLPDLDALKSIAGDVVGVFLTHGHEDHIGGVSYLLRAVGDVPVVGSRFTLALLAPKLAEAKVDASLVEVREGDRTSLGPFDLEFFAVNHSIPDGLAVAITTAAGTALHTGDFKLDQTPLDGRVTDLRGFALLADRGIDVLLIDSTNADVPGFGITERELAPAMDQVFTSTPGRVVVSSFASHVHRIQQVIDAAHRHGRKVAYYGRSMERNMSIAQQLGYLTVPPGVLITARAARDLAPDKVALVCTGSQGEPMAALARMARGEHAIRITSGDTVLLASSLVPGNENAVADVVNGLVDQGAQVVHKGIAKVHVSSHATAGELLYVYNMLTPRFVIPVHGESRHLAANAAIAVQSGISSERIHSLRNGHTVTLDETGLHQSGAHPVRDLVVVDRRISEDAAQTLTERRQLAVAGIVTVLGIVETYSQRLAEPLEVLTVGVDHAGEWSPRLAAGITDRLLSAMRDGTQDLEQLERTARNAADRWLSRKFSSPPACAVLLVEDPPPAANEPAAGEADGTS
ncbi:ribonuclease J [Microbacterium profundi]|nr:ribonuclease J [Microbacterium profundi]